LSTLIHYLGRGHRKQSRLLERSTGDIHRDMQSRNRTTALISPYDNIHAWSHLRYVASYKIVNDDKDGNNMISEHLPPTDSITRLHGFYVDSKTSDQTNTFVTQSTSLFLCMNIGITDARVCYFDFHVIQTESTLCRLSDKLGRSGIEAKGGDCMSGHGCR
jgi:hypothetical protein